MPRNLQLTAGIRDADIDVERRVDQLQRTTTGDAVDHRQVNIGTTEATITIAANVTGGNGPGYALFFNRDGTNYVEIALTDTTANNFMRVEAGGIALLPLEPSVTTLKAKANTAAIELEFWIYER